MPGNGFYNSTAGNCKSHSLSFCFREEPSRAEMANVGCRCYQIPAQIGADIFIQSCILSAETGIGLGIFLSPDNACYPPMGGRPASPLWSQPFSSALFPSSLFVIHAWETQTVLRIFNPWNNYRYIHTLTYMVTVPISQGSKWGLKRLNI